MVAGRRIPVQIKPSREVSRIVITGIGVVSSAACGLAEFRSALNENKARFSKVERFRVDDCRAKLAALVRDFKPRQLTPTLDVRRLDLLNQFACVSAGLAYSDACLTTRPVNPERIGTVLGLAAGPVSTQEAFEKNLSEAGVEGVSAKYFPSIVMSTVGGQVCQTLSLKGINSTVVDGVGAGLPAAIHAFEMLRASDREDQVIVVAPDEISRWLFRSLDLLGLIADPAEGIGPYHRASKGFVLGEGSVALVFERLESAQARGARIYAEILGYASNYRTSSIFEQSVDSDWISKCISDALRDADTNPSDIDFAVGLGCGRPAYDFAEKAAFESVLGESIPVSLPNSLLGMGIAGSGAAAIALGALGLTDKKVYAPAPGNLNKPAFFRKSLVFGGSEKGNNSALVLGLLQ